MNDTINVYTNNHFDPALASLLVPLVVLGAAALWLVCWREMRRAMDAAREAKELVAAQSALREGARFVAGKVEYAEGEPLAVRVTITQEGREIRGKSTSHEWNEIERRVEFRPFYLRLATGERVRIEPKGADVLLVDKLDKEHWIETYRRMKRAELDVGEHAIAEGILRKTYDPESAGEGYRGPGTGWVLAPLAGKIHVSTESIERRHELRARSFRRGLVFVPLFAALAMTPLYSYAKRATEGRDVEAQFYGRRYFETRNNKGQVTPHWVARYDAGDGAVREIEVDDYDYRTMLPEGQWSYSAFPQKIWVRQVEGSPLLDALGRGNSMHGGWWLASALMMFFGVGGYVFSKHKHRRWYERSLNDRGSGALPPPSGRVFAS